MMSSTYLYVHKRLQPSAQIRNFEPEIIYFFGRKTDKDLGNPRNEGFDIGWLKVQWEHDRQDEVTWELKNKLKTNYPELFGK